MAKNKPIKVEAGTSIDESFSHYVRECRKQNKYKSKNKNECVSKIQEARYGSLVAPFKPNLKFLMVFPVTDLTSEALKKAAEKVGFEITQCSTVDSAFDEFQSKHHDLIIIDTRSLRSLDYETLCRAIRGSKGSQHAPIVAVVKKSLFERDDGGILNLLECGFNRCISESSSVTNYINEIVQLKVSDMKPMAQKSTTQALYAALDRCNGLIFITDETFKCQYANIFIEKFLNIRQEDIVGRNLGENVVYDQSQLAIIASSLLRGKEWMGQLTLQKKSHEVATVICKAVSIACYGRLPTHFVLILEVPEVNDTDTSVKTNNQQVEQRRLSDFRKASLNKMMALPLEAPIVKIISLLDEVREKVNENGDLVRILNEAEDLLKHSELYSTQLRENFRVKPEEPVVADLITALLSNQVQTSKLPTLTSRRSSNDSTINRPSKVLRRLATELDELLDNALQWDFEIFLLEEMTKSRPLQHLGMYLCQNFNVAAALNCDEKTLQNWFIIIESHYHSENFYHNSTHAADVMQATAGFLQKERIKIIMEPLDEAMCLLAAAAHDVDHPGKSSAFLSNSNSPLAVLYNDITILENHHCACMFKLTLGDERVNVFKNLDRDTYKIVRNNIVDMILATEMTKHFEHLAKFVNVFCAKADEEDDSEGDFVTLSTPENITLIKRMLIKCADVSNPTRPFRLYVEWARRIAEEYFQQTDEEKVKGLPVVMPMFDRNTCSVPKSQIGFIDYIVNDMFEAWNAFIDMSELIAYLRQNYIRWKEFDEQGHRTLADIRLLQSSVLMAPILPARPRPTAR
ncbi:high affinity cAMP-specific and IBMX-insensitive 3',5'-cyclic phosphodiesterase 8-like isoform X2 [Coccinella septempunctata]|uniref:high affinity cAMP-specific and IBMX-insensitive 3',5'-cyclic phosphodiesterase 8-like isoform X2 n=1 Tax=Coccinella septempunctata TaxID=41139 RepID=UPI001D095101|nr:high affinity cAMP-specific and IBMX-insensitive 3',5'-cyclic phosphodiesterase 8-like isoform X2 [Coccinella septempunctata]